MTRSSPRPSWSARSPRRHLGALLAAASLLVGTVAVVLAPSAALASPPIGTITTWPTNIGDIPYDITTGPDGALWFTNNTTPAIGRITTSGTISSYATPGFGIAKGITAGPDGALWFTSIGKLGRITTAGAVSSFSDSRIGEADGIVTGPDGALWFTASNPGGGGAAIGRITTGGSLSFTSVPGGGLLQGITVGPDGALWFVSQRSLAAPLPTDPAVGRITTAGAVTLYTDPSILDPFDIADGGDGGLWFTSGDHIGRIDATTKQITSFAAVAVDSTPLWGITRAGDGNLWFASPNGKKVGRITTAGTVTLFPVASNLYPYYLAAGPDGALWFTNGGADKTIAAIGRLWPGSAPARPAPPVGTAGDRQVTVTWTAPDDGASPITGYQVRSYVDGVETPATCSWTSGPLTCVVGGLTNGTTYTFDVRATNALGTGPPSNPSAPVTPHAGDLFHALAAPVRILDSRPPPEQVGPFATPWAAGTIRHVPVGGVGGVPANATAVTLNVTVTGTTAASFLTAWPTGATQPTASSVNWVAGQTIPNAVTVKLGSGGTVDVFNPSGSADVIFDVVGYYDASGTGAGLVAQAPTRLLDSRPPPEQVGPFATPWAAGTDRSVDVAGVGGIPADAEAVVANVTVTGTTAESFLTLYPDGASRPVTSNLNWKAGVTVPNAVTIRVGTGGRIRAFNNSGTANVIIDVVGYFVTGRGNGFHPVAPVRFQDSRPAPDNVGPYTTPWTAGSSRAVAVTTAGAAPTRAQAVLANVTVTNSSAESFLTVYPAGAPAPTASNLNWKAGVTIANATTAKVGTASALTVFNNSGSVDVIADLAGWYG